MCKSSVCVQCIARKYYAALDIDFISDTAELFIFLLLNFLDNKNYFVFNC